MEHLKQILKELMQERDRLDKAIAALEAVKMPRGRGLAQSQATPRSRRTRRRFSAAALRNIALGQKRRRAKERKMARTAV